MGRAEAAGARNAEMASASLPFSLALALEPDLEAVLGVTELPLRVSPTAARIRLSGNVSSVSYFASIFKPGNVLLDDSSTLAFRFWAEAPDAADAFVLEPDDPFSYQSFPFHSNIAFCKAGNESIVSFCRHFTFFDLPLSRRYHSLKRKSNLVLVNSVSLGLSLRNSCKRYIMSARVVKCTCVKGVGLT